MMMMPREIGLAEAVSPHRNSGLFVLEPTWWCIRPYPVLYAEGEINLITLQHDFYTSYTVLCSVVYIFFPI